MTAWDVFTIARPAFKCVRIRIVRLSFSVVNGLIEIIPATNDVAGPRDHCPEIEAFPVDLRAIRRPSERCRA